MCAAPVGAPFTVTSECSSLRFLMEIVFVHSESHSGARRGGVETGVFQFISGPQSIFFVLPLGVQPRLVNCPLQPPHRPTNNHRHNWLKAFICTKQQLLQLQVDTSKNFATKLMNVLLWSCDFFFPTMLWLSRNKKKKGKWGNRKERKKERIWNNLYPFFPLDI